MEKTKLYHSLVGKWDWLDIFFLFEGDWIQLKSHEVGDHIWNFRYDGLMVSQSEGEPYLCVNYSFDPTIGTLVLDGYDLDSQGNPHARIYERYIVEFRDNEELLLYDTETFLGQPAPSLRLTLRRKLQ